MAEGPPRRPPAEPEGPSPGGGDGQSGEWAILRTAPNQLTAEMWRELLLSEGVPATIAPGDTFAFLGLTPAPCRLLVPASLLARAETVLAGESWTLEEER